MRENLVRILTAKQVSRSHPYLILANGFPSPARTLPFLTSFQKDRIKNIGFEKSVGPTPIKVLSKYSLANEFLCYNVVIKQTQTLDQSQEIKRTCKPGRDVGTVMFTISESAADLIGAIQGFH